MKVSYVLELIDGYTNRMVTENHFKVSLAGGKPPLWKDGFFVFLNLSPAVYDVSIQSDIYQTIQIQIKITESSGLHSFEKIRLQPSIMYPRKEMDIVLFGKHAMQKKVYAYSRDFNESYKLEKDYQGENTICVRHSAGVDLSQKIFLIKDKINHDFFTLEDWVEEEKHEYIISNPFEHSYRRTESEIYAVYETNVEQDGTFFFLFHGKNSLIKKKALRLGVLENQETDKLKLNVWQGKEMAMENAVQIEIAPRKGNEITL